ncbi:hypothetical protein Tco_0605635 [Tanacetum coccineum]
MRVWAPPSRVILFGDIPTVIPSTSVVAPETSTLLLLFHLPLLWLRRLLSLHPLDCVAWFPIRIPILIHQMRCLHQSTFPRTSLLQFLCTDSSKAPDSSDRPPSQDPYVMVVAVGGASEAFRRWCAAPLSTLYPPTTSESSSGDSSERPMHSSSHSIGPSRKRCRFLVDSVPSSTPVIGSLAPTRADLLPPRKRFRDSYSSEASIEEDTEIDPIETEVDMELGIGDGDDVRDHVEIDPRDVRDDTKEYEADTSAGDTVEVGIDPMSAPIVEEEIVEPAGEDSSNSSGTRDGIVRSFEDMPIDLNDAVHDFYHHMSEVRIDRIVGDWTLETGWRLICMDSRGQRVSMIERIDSLRLENLKVRAMLDIERDRVNSLRLHMSLSQEEFRQVRRDRDDTRGRLRRLESYVERRLGDNGDGNENGRGDRPGARECTYQDFMKCQPLSFKGTEGVVGLIRWSEKMETVFHISNYPERYQVKYATCTLLDRGAVEADGLKCTALRNEILKMERDLEFVGEEK